MGYEFDCYGSFKFDKQLPLKVLDIFKKVNDDYELGQEAYVKLFNNSRIEAEWCPWCYNAESNELELIDRVNSFSHNYYFIDWLAWIVESICLPNNLKLNGSGYWNDDGNYEEREARDYGEFPKSYLPEGDGEYEVIDNFIKVRGEFFGSDYWKKTIRKTNNIIKPKEVIAKKPTTNSKGSFCITGKVSMSRNDFLKFGVEHGFEFKSSVTKDLTYLVCNDPNSTSTKIKNAKKNGIKVITEEDFCKIAKG